MFTPDELKAGGAVVAAAVAGFFAWVAGNRQGRAAFLTATSQAADLLIGRYEAMVGTLMKRVTTLESEVADCHAKHARCEAEMEDLRRLITDGPPRKAK